MTLLSYVHNDACDYCRSMMLVGNMDTKAAQHTVEVCTSLDLYMERSDTLHNIWDYACTKTLVEGLELLYCPTDDLFTASLLSTDGFQEDLESKLAYLKLDSDLRCRRCYPDKHLAEKISKLPKRIQEKWGLETMFDSLVYVNEGLDDAETFANQLEKNLAEEHELRYDDDNDEWIDTNTNDVVDFHVDVEEVELA